MDSINRSYPTNIDLSSFIICMYRYLKSYLHSLLHGQYQQLYGKLIIVDVSCHQLYEFNVFGATYLERPQSGHNACRCLLNLPFCVVLIVSYEPFAVGLG